MQENNKKNLLLQNKTKSYECIIDAAVVDLIWFQKRTLAPNIPQLPKAINYMGERGL